MRDWRFHISFTSPKWHDGEIRPLVAARPPNGAGLWEFKCPPPPPPLQLAQRAPGGPNEIENILAARRAPRARSLLIDCLRAARLVGLHAEAPGRHQSFSPACFHLGRRPRRPLGLAAPAGRQNPSTFRARPTNHHRALARGFKFVCASWPAPTPPPPLAHLTGAMLSSVRPPAARVSRERRRPSRRPSGRREQSGARLFLAALGAGRTLCNARAPRRAAQLAGRPLGRARTQDVACESSACKFAIVVLRAASRLASRPRRAHERPFAR